MNDEIAKLEQMVALLTRKADREQQAKIAAEKLLDEKSRELYLAKQLVEESLSSIQEKSDQDIALIKLKSYLESILLDFNQNFLQKPLSNSLLQLLVDDLSAIEQIDAIELVFRNAQQAQSLLRFHTGKEVNWQALPETIKFGWSDDFSQLTVNISADKEFLGHFRIALSVPENWIHTIEKQLLVFGDMLLAAYQRQALLDRTLAAKQRAEQSERSTRDFVAMINHELRTPLSGVVGSTELMLQTQLTAEQKALLNTMMQSGELLKVIINDLLDVSKINAGMLQLNEAAFDPLQLCNMIKDTFTIQTQEKQLAFEFSYQPAIPPRLVGDPDRIKQLFVNLIGNAIKFTEQGSINVDVQWSNEMFCFTVTDTGCGIPQESIDSIFEPFTQANNRSNRKFEGTGLGLTICRLLVSEMNGHISIDSDINVGTTFSIALPLRIAKQSQVATSTPETQIDISQLSVLVVEDSHTNQMLIKLMLAKLNIEPSIAANGQEAIEYLNHNQVDIVFMDCRMPIVDGYEATMILRNQGYAKPIIALTAGTTSTERELCFDAGMDDIVSKPYKLDDLRCALTQWGNQPSKAGSG
ncbi:ATP-binding protein [Shewanella waksmanii]|uniref:ATP-binding protein n=1 Tax=Shewanella waksmanii TaxID=213783 RepID=UPI00048BE744|nr:ATP-binding protein [Shewanella waksmanii]